MSTPPPRIALLEDSVDLREELLFFLQSQGYPAWASDSAEGFWKKLHASRADIVLVDLGLPGEDGFSVVDYLRQLSGFGLIIVTARGSQRDKLRGLDLGADLYLVKPIDFDDLVRAIDALWLRMRQNPPPAPAAAAPAAAAAPCWRLDGKAFHLVAPNGCILKLSRLEYALLEVLSRHPGEVCSRRGLYDQLFGYDPDADTHRLDVILSRLRQKAAQHRLRLPVRTVFGQGLVFADTRHD